MKKELTLWRRYKEWVKKTFPGKPPQTIEKWDFIMVFQDRYEQQIKIYFEKYLTLDSPNNGFAIIANKQQNQTLVVIGIDEKEVHHQAEVLKILKRKQKQSYGFDLKTINREIYLAEERKQITFCNYLKWVRARLSPENHKIYNQEQYSVFNKKKIEKYLPNEDRYDENDLSLFTPDEQLRAKYNYLLTYCIEQNGPTNHVKMQFYPLADIMRHAGFKQLVPIHKDSKYGRIVLGNLKEYLGANSQTYFAFVAFLQKWLVFPALVGVLTTIWNYVFHYTAEDSPADFIYAFIIMIWSIIFVTQWEHRQKWTAACEKTGYNEEWSEHQNMIDREGCKVRESRVSGQKEQYVPLLQKIWRHFLSISVCSSVLVATLYFMVLSLNARGFVDEKHTFLYFEQISAWAKSGGIFDSQTSWAQIPNLVHVLVTNIFDEQVYRPLTKKFTKYQQHFSNSTYQNSIIIKFFIYEFIITFADLFYIAFVRMDIEGLREQLLSLFFIDIIRRLVAELIIPKLIRVKQTYAMQPTDPHHQREQLESQVRLEVNKVDYEPFDDYLEIVTNFGYLVMISSCFPLAPLLILIAHSIETVQDKYKIIHIFRRKLPTKYVGMGYWNNIVLFLCFTAIITNILLFAFSSHQIATIFPKLYQSGKDLLLGNTELLDMVSDAASSVIESVIESTNDMASMVFNEGMGQVLNSTTFVDSPFSPYCQSTSMVSQFLAPAEQHEIEFISILFVIEHIFLIMFLCLRNILSKQKCEADVLVQRRQKKREIKKYFKQRAVLSWFLRDSVVSKLIEGNRQGVEVRDSQDKLPQLFSSLFASASTTISEPTITDESKTE